MRDSGQTASMSASLKKTRQKRVTSLLDKITLLEAANKQTQASMTLDELTQSCTLLLDELGIKYKRRLILMQKVFYEQGDKCIRLLAKYLKSKQASILIHYCGP